MSGIIRSIGKSFSRIDGKKFVTGLAVAAGAYYLGGMISGSFDSANGVAPGGGDESDGLNMNPGDTSFGANPTNEAGGGLAMPSQDVTNMATVPDTPAPTGLEAPTQPTSTTIPPASPAPAAAPAAPQQLTPSGPSAPSPAGSITTPPTVKDLSTQATTPKTPSLPQGSNVGEWFKSLSAPAQAAIAGGVAGGASAVMNAIAAKNAQDFAIEKEQRGRDDVIRRGKVMSFGDSAFVPKTGIINGVRGK